MAGISNISIKYNEVTYDGIDYCEIEITGTLTAADAGQYAIVRHAADCETPYTMEVVQCAANETIQFVARDVINIEGAGSEFHPTTGEVTDLYLKYGGEQIGDAYRFTVGNCGKDDDGKIGTKEILIGAALLIGAYVLFAKKE